MNFQIERYLNIYFEALRNKDTFHLIAYEEIIQNPQKVLNNVYNFLNLPLYDHTFNSIKKVNTFDDDFAFGIPSLHEVRPTIKKVSQDPKSVLSDYILNKYANYLEDFNENNF